jgi:hypothetical protein
MLRLTALLLLTVTTISAQSCEFCPGNAAPGKPDYVLLEGLTCANFDDMSNDYSTDDCTALQTSPYPFLCQCPGLEGSCAGICPDGSAVGRPDLIVQSEGLSCSEYDALAKSTSDATQCTEYQSGYSGYCGCDGVTPTCIGICQEGETLTLPDVAIFGGLFSCAEYDTTVRFELASDVSCSQSQARFSGVCGCKVMVPTAPSTAKPTTATMPGTPSKGPFAAPTLAPVPTPVALVTNVPTQGLTDSPVTDAPIMPVPVSEDPVAVPITSAPVAASITSAPVTDPITDAPVTSVTSGPVADLTTDAPVVSVTSAPVADPTTDAPITSAPVASTISEAPIALPLTNTPVTSAPAAITSAPVTFAPVSPIPSDSMAPVSSDPGDGNVTVTTTAPSQPVTPPPAANLPSLFPSSSIRSGVCLPVVFAMSLLVAIF